jgi:hypothetical protein
MQYCFYELCSTGIVIDSMNQIFWGYFYKFFINLPCDSEGFKKSSQQVDKFGVNEIEAD